jgi:imidazolonepropionase-like amidohydrolase
MRTIPALLAACLSVACASAQNDAGPIVFQHANVIDGYSSSPLRDVSVHVAGGKIVSIETRETKPPANARVFDLAGKWLLPGYIDAHVHFLNIQAAKTAVLLGSTTVRTMHCERFLDITLREQHRAGQRDLPDVIAAGYQIRPDMAGSFFQDFPDLADMKPRLTGVDNVRRVVRALVSRKVDHVKFLATERAGTPETDPRKQTFSDEEIAAIVDEARRAGLRASAHAHGDEGARAAIMAGVHSLEHGTHLSPESLQLMQQKQIFLSPTFTGQVLPPFRPQDRDNPILAERRRSAIPIRNKVVAEAVRLNIPIVAGTDWIYANTTLSMGDEAALMHQAGMPPMLILQALTSTSAKCLGIEDRTGSIKAGMEADLVVVGSDPLATIEALRDLCMVVNDGVVILDQLKR